jgi:hypothetical protein
MDDAVLSALAKWPNVPACYGWIRLDARGRWHLGQDGGAHEIVRHAGLANFLGRNYACNEHGEWFCQNGPQRAYVVFDLVPWVARLFDAHVETHTGVRIAHIDAVLLDEHARVYFACEHGCASLDDRDLARFVDALCDADGKRVPDEALTTVIDTAETFATSSIFWRSALGLIPLQPCRHALLEARFGFCGRPCPR